ncbi:hypothetical protein [Jiangella alba]|uniref:Uncharacterized protein n=1 Tax=Jiangella alba TaxID=561176 RepID=A0A1H5H4E0_9ACTN|nr:hypothetical protein [Jiangella alba]SEE22790.1 hypothetical protein SAMN04488561_0748 [Jiangella alba]
MRTRRGVRALAAAQLVLEVFADPSRDAIWAKYHYTDAGDGVIVNLVAGWEDTVVGPEIQRVIATAPAPVEVREVEHSHDDLMRPVHDLMGGDRSFAGATMVSATVDAERVGAVTAVLGRTCSSVRTSRRPSPDHMCSTLSSWGVMPRVSKTRCAVLAMSVPS